MNINECFIHWKQYHLFLSQEPWHTNSINEAETQTRSGWWLQSVPHHYSVQGEYTMFGTRRSGSHTILQIGAYDDMKSYVYTARVADLSFGLSTLLLLAAYFRRRYPRDS
jgi:hypothetical protein